jgi:hypothetical protein
MDKNTAPYKEFGQNIDKAENPKDVFVIAPGEVFKEGDRVYGTWVNVDGSTYYQEGIIIKNPKTGLWVQTEPDGGITEIKRFLFLNHQTFNNGH